MSQKAFAPIFIVIIALVLIGLVGGTAYLTKQSPKPTIQPQMARPSLTPSSQPPVNWQTYTDQQYGFSFQYPVEAVVRNVMETPKRVKVMRIGPTQVASGRIQTELFDGYSFTVTFFSEAKDGSISVLSEKMYNSAKQACSEATFSPIKDVQIAGKNAKTYSVENCLGNYTETFVGNHGYVYDITQIYSGNDKLLERTYQDTISQILATFRFTDQAQTDTTVSWKTYTNIKYKYSFEYPSDFNLIVNDNEKSIIATYFGPTQIAIGRFSTLVEGASVHIDFATTNQAVQDFASAIWKNSTNGQIPNAKVGSLSQTELGGKKVYMFTIESNGLDKNYFVQSQDGVLLINGTYKGTNTLYKQNIDDMLATFKFTN